MPVSPSIRERACPARLRPAPVMTTHWRATTRGGKDGCLLRDRLGRRPPRHRAGGPGRAAAGPPPDQRRRGRPGPAAGPAGRARRHCGGPGPGGDRDAPRAAGRVPARTGRPVYPINPMAVARYRDRHSVAGKKSDHGDSYVLANVLRTDLHAHRPLPADSELAQAIAVLARAQQNAVWDRTQAHNRLRSHLREYYPAFLAAFAPLKGGITRPRPAPSWPPRPLAIPSKRGHLRLVDSCNFSALCGYRTPVHFVPRRPLVRGARWSPDAPRPGRGRLAPARISCLRGRSGLRGQARSAGPSPQAMRSRLDAGGAAPYPRAARPPATARQPPGRERRRSRLRPGLGPRSGRPRSRGVLSRQRPLVGHRGDPAQRGVLMLLWGSDWCRAC